MADFLIELLSKLLRRRKLWPLAVIPAVAIVLFLGTWLIVHFSAEPGTEVSVWGFTYTKSTSASTSDRDAQMEKAEKQFERSEYDDCANTLRPLAKNYPGNAEIHQKLGRCLSFYPSSRDEAIQELKEAIRINPSYYEAHFNLAAVYKDEQDYDKSEEHAKKALEVNPTSSRVNMFLAHIADLKADPDKAKKQYNIVIERNMDFREWAYLKRAIILLKYSKPNDSSVQSAADDISSGMEKAIAHSKKRRDEYAAELCKNLKDPTSSLFSVRSNPTFIKKLIPYQQLLKLHSC